MFYKKIFGGCAREPRLNLHPGVPETHLNWPYAYFKINIVKFKLRFFWFHLELQKHEKTHNYHIFWTSWKLQHTKKTTRHWKLFEWKSWKKLITTSRNDWIPLSVKVRVAAERQTETSPPNLLSFLRATTYKKHWDTEIFSKKNIEKSLTWPLQMTEHFFFWFFSDLPDLEDSEGPGDGPSEYSAVMLLLTSLARCGIA